MIYIRVLAVYFVALVIRVDAAATDMNMSESGSQHSTLSYSSPDARQTTDPVNRNVQGDLAATDRPPQSMSLETIIYSDASVVDNEVATSPTERVGTQISWISDEGSVSSSVSTGSPEGGLETTSEDTPTVTWKWRSIRWSWFTILKQVSSVTGIIGNLLVILVVWRRRAVNRSTDTLIGALAAADFVTSICFIPIPAASAVPSTLLGELYCRLIHTSYVLWCSVFASVYTLALIPVERLIAVLYPIQFNRFFGRKHASYAVLVVWFFAMIHMLYPLIIYSVDGAEHVCMSRYPNPSAQYAVGILMFLVQFFIPAAVMLAAQAVTAYILYRKSRQFLEESATNGRSNHQDNMLMAKNNVLKMLFVVAMIFIICWGPTSIVYFLYNIGAIDRSYLYGDLDEMLNLLAFFNSCLNPIVYTIRHPQFREAIRELFTGAKTHEGLLFSYRDTKE